jgi:hypothetical protein
MALVPGGTTRRSGPAICSFTDKPFLFEITIVRFSCRRLVASVPSPKSLGLRCVQNGSSARREEGAYPDRYVTDEQRSSRPIFNATPWAAAGWLFFCVARSTVMIQIAALRSRLEKQPTDLRRNPRDLGDGAPGRRLHGTGSLEVQAHFDHVRF